MWSTDEKRSNLKMQTNRVTIHDMTIEEQQPVQVDNVEIV